QGAGRATGPEGPEWPEGQARAGRQGSRQPGRRAVSTLRNALLPALVPLLFAACTTVGPDYHVPDNAAVKAEAANGPLLGTNNPAVSIAEGPDGWWRLYDDPKLDQLVQQALVANTDLRVAAANLKRAIAVYHEVEAENLPVAR